MEPDYEKAATALEKACEADDFPSCNLLAGLYEDDLFLPADEERWRRYNEKACKGGFEPACEALRR